MSCPLPQPATLELRLAGSYATNTYSFAVLWRLMSVQHRFDINHGTIVGKGFRPGGWLWYFVSQHRLAIQQRTAVISTELPALSSAEC